jgi:hypothetical protein
MCREAAHSAITASSTATTLPLRQALDQRDSVVPVPHVPAYTTFGLSVARICNVRSYAHLDSPRAVKGAKAVQTAPAVRGASTGDPRLQICPGSGCAGGDAGPGGLGGAAGNGGKAGRVEVLANSRSAQARVEINAVGGAPGKPSAGGKGALRDAADPRVRLEVFAERRDGGVKQVELGPMCRQGAAGSGATVSAAVGDQTLRAVEGLRLP